MQQRSEETRSHILAAAQKLFAQAGYDASGVAEICSEAGVSKGAFYHHFPSKQDVFLALLDDWLNGLNAELGQGLGTAENVRDGLLNMAGETQSVFHAADGRVPMFLEFWTQASRNPVFWRAAIAPYHHYLDLFTGLVKRGIQEGTIKDVDPELAGRTILAFAMGMLLQGLFDPQGAAWDQMMQDGLKLLLEGMDRRQV